MSKEDLLNKLNTRFLSYGSHELRDYELQMGEFASDVFTFLSLQTKEDVYLFCKDFIHQYISKGDTDAAYNCFYFMSIFTRRNLDYFVFEDLVANYQSIFSEYSTYFHIMSVYYLSVGIPSSKYMDLLQTGLLKYGMFQNHAGIVHCYADIVATIYESSLISEDHKLLDIIEKNYLTEALKAIDKAITLENNHKYAKFYSTKGRLLVIDKQYEAGKLFLMKAISYEDSTHSSRIITYRNYILKADIIASYHSYQKMKKDTLNEQNQFKTLIEEEMKQNSDKIEKTIEESTIKNIEILTFFTGLIGFLVSSITIAVSSDNLKDAYSLIIVVFGSFLAAFSMMDAIVKIKYSRSFWSYVPNSIAVLLGIGVFFFMYNR